MKIDKNAPPYPKQSWTLIVRLSVGEADRFAIARQFGRWHALASLESCREYLAQEGDGGLEELRGVPNDTAYEAWVAAGRPFRVTKGMGA